MTAVLDRPQARPDDAPARGRAVVAALAVAVLALVGGLLLGRGTGDGVDVDDPVSVGFLQDMAVHHAQALEISAAGHASSGDAELR